MKHRHFRINANKEISEPKIKNFPFSADAGRD
jgi:hypothetical protein